MNTVAETNSLRSLVDTLRQMPLGKRQQVISQLTDEQANNALYDWEGIWARPEQLPPSEDWYIWLLLSGRGFGKTRTGAELVCKWAKLGYTPIALIGQTKGDVRDTMIEVGDSSILKISPPDFMPIYAPSKRRLTWPNGVVAIAYSGDEPNQLRGPQHMKSWCDELSKFMYPKETWDNLLMGLRIGDSPQCIVTTTPRPIKIIKDLAADQQTTVTRGHTMDNRLNLAPQFLKKMLSKYEGTKLGRQELAGEILDSMEGLVYDSFDQNTCVIQRRAIPPDWPCYTAHDFGLNNTVCLWYAQEPSTGFFYLYRSYHKGGSVAEHAQNFKELSEGEDIVRRVGGNHQEQEIRDGYALAGWPITEPVLRSRESQLDRVWSLHKYNKIYVFSDEHDYIDEKMSFAWEVDDDERVTHKIHDEAYFHRMAAERYLMSEFRPDLVVSNKIGHQRHTGEVKQWQS